MEYRQGFRLVYFRLTILVLFICATICNGVICAEETLLELNKKEVVKLYNSEGIVKVNFYRWDRKTNEREEFIGTAELKEGKLTFDVEDIRLEKMLKGDFHTMIPVEEDGKRINKFVTYKVGTIKHLQSVIEHCKDVSFIAEIMKE